MLNMKNKAEIGEKRKRKRKLNEYGAQSSLGYQSIRKGNRDGEKERERER